MTKNEFVRKFAEDNQTTYVLAEQWVNALFVQLAQEIVDNPRLEIRGLGVFTHQKYAGRTARDFNTGETLHLPDTMGVKFKPSKVLVQKMHDYYPVVVD